MTPNGQKFLLPRGFRVPIRAVVLPLLALLSGCATESALSPPPPLPPAAFETSVAAVTTSGSVAVSDRPPIIQTTWWEYFNDPLLSALVTQALQANTDVRTARIALQQSRALRDTKTAGLLPTLNASAVAQRNQSGSNTASDSFQLGFDAGWEIDVFGAQRSAVNAAEADILAAQASLAQVQVSMAGEVAVSYMELRGLQTRLSIARSNLSAQMEMQQIAQWRVQAGLASSLDVEQAVAASEQTSAQLPVLATSLAQNISALAVLTGQATQVLHGQLSAGGDSVSNMAQAPAHLAVAIPAQTLQNRPDVQAAEYRVQAALARVAQADAARYPGFHISGSLGLRALTLGALTNGASAIQALLASISVPLFDGGAARAQLSVQDAALEQARTAYQATVLAALKDVEFALVALKGNRERLARLETAAQAAANADLMARQRYASGLIDFRAVLDTQRTLLSTQDSVAATRASLNADHVRLYKALGGGWIAETDSP